MLALNECDQQIVEAAVAASAAGSFDLAFRLLREAGVDACPLCGSLGAELHPQARVYLVRVSPSSWATVIPGILVPCRRLAVFMPGAFPNYGWLCGVGFTKCVNRYFEITKTQWIRFEEMSRLIPVDD